MKRKLYVLSVILFTLMLSGCGVFTLAGRMLKNDRNEETVSSTEMPSPSETPVPTEEPYALTDPVPEEGSFSYDGLVFTYEGTEYDLTDVGTPANTILDAYRVGNWIVVEGHVNPHHSAYHLFNTDSLQFERTLIGANLAWKDDDITTAVYSDYSALYNYKGNIIASYQNEEIMGVSYSDDGYYVEVELWHVNDGEEITDNRYVEVSDGDRAMYRYADYLRKSTPERWDAFMAEAPENAALFVIVNPPEDVAAHLPIGETEKGIPTGSDRVIIVSLYDNSFLVMDHGTINFDEDGMRFVTDSSGEEYRLDRGEAHNYAMTVPEGIPSCQLTADTDKGTVIWQVCMLSGESNISCRFLDDGKADRRALDAYEEILGQYRKAWEEGYSQDRFEDEDFYTELINYAWPLGSPEDAAGYVLYDIDHDGIRELIITYYGNIAEIYGFDGKKATYAYGCVYRAEATLYEDGMLLQNYGTMTYASQEWYRFDPVIGRMLPVAEMNYTPTEDEPENVEYYLYAAEGSWGEIERNYKEYGDLPVWAWEWGDMITEEEYQQYASSGKIVELPESKLLSTFEELE